MKYIKYFEDSKPRKFIKMVPINKDDKTFFRKQNVGSMTNFTKQNFLYLEKVFGNKLSEYKNWLLNIYKLNYYNDKNIYVDTQLEIFRLFPIDQAYRKYLIKQEFPGNKGSKELGKIQHEIRKRYLSMIFKKSTPPEVYTISHIKGASLNIPIGVKEHPFMREIEIASNPPDNIEKANVVAGTDIGNKIISKKEKEKEIENYHRAKAVNILVNDFNDALSSLDYSNIKGFKLINILNQLKSKSKVYFSAVMIDDDTELIITQTNGKENIRTIKQLITYLRTVSNQSVKYINKIELRIQ